MVLAMAMALVMAMAMADNIRIGLRFPPTYGLPPFTATPVLAAPEYSSPLHSAEGAAFLGGVNDQRGHYHCKPHNCHDRK